AAESPDEATDTDRPHVEISAPFSAGADPISGVAAGQSVAQTAFKLEKDGDVPDDLIKLEDGYAVIQLKEKNPATRERFDADRESFVTALLAAKQSDALNGYVMRLRDSAKSEIKINDSFAKGPAKDKHEPSEEE